VLLGVGLVSAPLGRLHRARDVCAEAADLCRSVGDDRGTGDALITLGAVLWALDDLDGAAAAHDEAIRRLARSDSWRQDVAAVLRSRTSVDRGEPDATDRVAAALQAARRTRDAHLVGLALLQQCRDALRKGRRDEAVGAARGALQASRRIRYREGEAAALTLLARGHLLAPAEEDEVAAAREAAEEAISLAVSIDHRGALCHAVETLGAVRAAAGDDAEALLLLEVAAADRERRQMPNARVERALTLDLTGELRERLGASAADVAREAAGTPIDTLIRERRLGTARPAP
jgi:tetratricopeptide (TPR) repeat protein